MRIALDFDDTYTADVVLWDRFIAHAKERGHTVVVVTARRDTDENRETVQVPGCSVVFTNLRSKLLVCKERGMAVDIWIDDMPEKLVNGH